MSDPQDQKPTSNLRLLVVMGVLAALAFGYVALLKSIPALNQVPECMESDTSTRCKAHFAAERLRHGRY